MARTDRARWILLGLMTAAFGCKGPPPTSPAAVATEPTELFWGDFHVHSSASPDAVEGDRRAVDIDSAYRFARGAPTVHPYTRARVQLQRPLDFVAVTDHGESLDEATWRRAVEAAEQHYAPCAFTTFVGWEWTGTDKGYPIHRIVLMNRDMKAALDLTPFGARSGARPADLWDWLAETSTRVGADFLAIPHGPNLSGGRMFPSVDAAGASVDEADAKARARWEPLAAVTQIEGDAETHPQLSPDDAFADFERYAGVDESPTEAEDGAYLRSALMRGLQLGRSTGVNPFQVGMVGSTGSHTGLAAADEARFWGAPPGPQSGDLGAQGLTGVWAHENTRTAIFRALRNREVYATTGPRIRVRFFGSWAFEKKQATKANMVQVGYRFGYPMGSELTQAPNGKAPRFLMYAIKDPEGANLDRIQMVKGWLDAEGDAHEKVYDVVWSPGRQRDADGKLEPVTNTVDLETGRYADDSGAQALHGFWSDPDFDPEAPAFYYLRVLQVPTPRHTLYDAVAEGRDPTASAHPATIQERAYTTPIWYTP